MTEEEMRAVAWQTVCTRIDDLASCLDTAGRTMPHDVQQIQDVNRSLTQLDDAIARFRAGIAPRLAATGWPDAAR